MTNIEPMLAAHPVRADVEHPGWLAAVAACRDCAQICRNCADACVSEAKGPELIGCIRANLDGAAICDATAQVLSRTSEPNWPVVQELLDACVLACRACAEECGHHAEMMEHCRICADSCSHCADRCSILRRGAGDAGA